MPKISVIIPVYNVGKYLSECLDSVINQTFSDTEIICINDGSTDNSAEILEEYTKKDKRIKVITQKHSGVVTARNKAIASAKSEYIYPLDGDDVIMPDCLEKLYNAIISGKGDIITNRVMYFGRETHEYVLPKPNKYNMIHDTCLVNAALIRKSDFEKSGGYDTEFNVALEDYDFWLNMVFKQNKKIYRIPEILFYYRLKPKSEARNFQHRSEHALLQKKLEKKYPVIRRYLLLESLLKPVKKIVRFLFRIEDDHIRIFKTIRFRIKKHINVFYFNSVSNFGDLLNIDLIEKISGKQIKQKWYDKADMVVIGSLLQALVMPKISFRKKISRLLRKPLIVFGTGFIEDTPYNNVARKLDVRAVRGKNSLEKLRALKHVKISDDVVLGDPGLLVSLLIDCSKIKKKYDLGIIPHYVDANHPLLKKINVKNSIILDITQPPHILLPKIAQCKCIISSAMHGLIAADSLGIPNIRMVLSDKITGGDYKFNDYYSVFGITNHPRIIIDKKTKITDTKFIVNQYKITPQQVNEICNQLLTAFLQIWGKK